MKSPLVPFLVRLFLLTRPMRDVTVGETVVITVTVISTHTSHAGRDVFLHFRGNSFQIFLLTRPMRDVTRYYRPPDRDQAISAHTSHAGRDKEKPKPEKKSVHISTHTSHAGRDEKGAKRVWVCRHFYSHVPCGT